MYKFPNGLHSVSKKYKGLLVPIAQYVLTKTIGESSPQIITDSSMDKRVGLSDIPIDVGKTEPMISSLCAIYPDMVVNAYFKYDDFILVCRSKDRNKAKKWLDNLDQTMMVDNQYIGKCLYCENGNLIFKETPDVTWDDVVLRDDKKKEIRSNTIGFFNNTNLHKFVKKRGLNFYGRPGTGKTSVVKATFNELGEKASRIYVTTDSFKYMGVGSLFEILDYLGPSVLAFEDMDMVGVGREISVGGGGILGDLLTNLDGMRNTKYPFVVISTTNKKDMMDEALTNRPGRFDRNIEIDLPDRPELAKMYQKLLGFEIDANALAMSQDFTGSHVREAVNTARIISEETGQSLQDSLEEAIRIVRENFFGDGGNVIRMKAAIQSLIIKKGIR